MARLLFVHHDHHLSPGGPGGGCETALFGLSRACSRLGHTVSILARASGNFELADGVTVISTGETYDACEVAPRAAATNPDRVIAITRADALPSLAEVLPSVPRYLWFQESDLFRTFSDAETMNRCVTGFLYVSRSQQRYYEDFGLDPEKAFLQHNCYDQRCFKESEAKRDPNRIVYAGALVPEKGIDLLIGAFLLARKRFPEATLHLFGSESMWDRPLQYSPKRSELLQSGIHLHGFVTDRILAAEFARSAVLVLPTRRRSYREGHPLTPLEAQACGCPVIVSDSGGLPETLEPGKSGWLLSGESEEELAAILEEVMGNPEQARRFGSYGARYVRENFNSDRWCRDFLARLALS